MKGWPVVGPSPICSPENLQDPERLAWLKIKEATFGEWDPLETSNETILDYQDVFENLISMNLASWQPIFLLDKKYFNPLLNLLSSPTLLIALGSISNNPQGMFSKEGNWGPSHLKLEYS